MGGAIGGNVAGGVMKHASLGFIGNSIVGVIGGGLGYQALAMLGAGGLAPIAGGSDIGAIIGAVASGGAGGGVLMIVLGLIRKILVR
jgi:hypothetical protein